MEEECTCGHVMLGNEDSGSLNWNPDCPTHGLDSPWWKSPEQTEKRRASSERLRDLQGQARAARQRAVEAHKRSLEEARHLEAVTTLRDEAVTTLRDAANAWLKRTALLPDDPESDADYFEMIAAWLDFVDDVWPVFTSLASSPAGSPARERGRGLQKWLREYAARQVEMIRRDQLVSAGFQDVYPNGKLALSMTTNKVVETQPELFRVRPGAPAQPRELGGQQ